MVARAPASAAVVLLLVGVAALGVCAPAEEADAAVASSSPAPAAGSGSEYQPPAVVPVQTHEEPCLRAGGLCVLESECPEGQLAATRGLCPAQEKRGVECCHGLSILERRCSARGGICRPKQKCGRSLWEEKAEDCASDETCCVLVA